MDQRDIPFLPVSELSRLIESREVSPVEVTQAYLDRIDELDFKFNAYLTVTRREALEAARGTRSKPSPAANTAARCTAYRWP